MLGTAALQVRTDVTIVVVRRHGFEGYRSFYSFFNEIGTYAYMHGEGRGRFYCTFSKVCRPRTENNHVQTWATQSGVGTHFFSLFLKIFRKKKNLNIKCSRISVQNFQPPSYDIVCKNATKNCFAMRLHTLNQNAEIMSEKIKYLLNDSNILYLHFFFKTFMFQRDVNEILDIYVDTFL